MCGYVFCCCACISRRCSLDFHKFGTHIHKQAFAKKIANVFDKFSNTSRSFGCSPTFSVMFGTARTCSDLLGYLQIHDHDTVSTSGCFWNRWDVFRTFPQICFFFVNSQLIYRIISLLFSSQRKPPNRIKYPVRRTVTEYSIISPCL